MEALPSASLATYQKILSRFSMQDENPAPTAVHPKNRLDIDASDADEEGIQLITNPPSEVSCTQGSNSPASRPVGAGLSDNPVRLDRPSGRTTLTQTNWRPPAGQRQSSG